MTLCRRYLVSGRVQGVSYRANAARAAQQIGVRGWVRNLDDGRVEALGVGSAEELAEFYAWLRRGPRFAEVTDVEVFEERAQVHADFVIRY
jgi:acylphosphatase